MRLRVKIAVAVSGAVIMAAGAGSAAFALVAPGSPPVRYPTFPGLVTGPYYLPGPVNLCVSQATQQVRVETRTLVLGNCATGEVQLTVTADPSALP